MKILNQMLSLFTAPHAPGAAATERPVALRAIALEPETTLDRVFRERVRQSPHAVAHLQHDSKIGRWRSFTWREFGTEVARWQRGLQGLGLEPGDRVALMLENCREWAIFDQAALGLGLVTVPLYTSDRAENVEFILKDCGPRVLLIGGTEQYQTLAAIRPVLEALHAVIALRDPGGMAPSNLLLAERWLPTGGDSLASGRTEPDTVASIVYTSGTTGPPKGVMLSHRNFLFNVDACLKAVAVNGQDRMLSFLPLSHTLERTVGYYAPLVAGIAVGYARSIPQLAEDLLTVRPTILVAVPRVFERVQAGIRGHLEGGSALNRWLFRLTLAAGWRAFLHGQGRQRWSPALLAFPLLDRVVARRVRERFGGRLRFAISGGAPLPTDTGRFLLSLGIRVLQGYGLTETSPVIAVNRIEDNEPVSVGPALPGVEVRTGLHEELLTRSPSVMLGYWNNDAATRVVVDEDGWLHTGDQAQVGPRGHITIIGRLKDILVLSNGEKVAPADVEQALAGCPIVEQVLVLGDGRPYLAAFVVLREGALEDLASAAGLEPDFRAASGSAARRLLAHPAVVEQALKRMQERMSQFPGYLRLRRVALMDEAWTVENGLMTPTLKLRRNAIIERFGPTAEALYERG